MSIFKTVMSESEPGKVYLVSEDRFLKWRCDCMSYTIQVGKGIKTPECKHIKKIKNEIGK